MSTHQASIIWQRSTDSFDYKTYNRDHIWRFSDDIELSASAAPDFLGNPDLVDPEQAFVASLSSCHMLTFLALAAFKKLTIDSYTDNAVGFLEKNADGKSAITRVELAPEIVFGGDAPSEEDLNAMHDKAHKECFIANSVLTKVTVTRTH